MSTIDDILGVPGQDGKKPAGEGAGHVPAMPGPADDRARERGEAGMAEAVTKPSANVRRTNPAMPGPADDRARERAEAEKGASLGKAGAQAAGTPETGARLDYKAMEEYLDSHRPETEEEKTRREKKEKRDKVFAAIGDGISALSNLYFTTKGAPNMYNPKNSLSAKAQERFDRLKAEREANEKEYWKTYNTLYGMQEADERADRDWRHKLRQYEDAKKYRDADEKRKNDEADLDRRLKESQIAAADSRAKQEAIKAEYLGDVQKATIDSRRAAANASNSRARSYAGGGKRQHLTIGGSTISYETKDDYERAVMGYAKEYGIDTDKEEVLARDWRGNPLKTRRTRRPVAEVAAEVEAASRLQQDYFSRYKVDDKRNPYVHQWGQRQDDFSKYKK